MPNILLAIPIGILGYSGIVLATTALIIKNKPIVPSINYRLFCALLIRSSLIVVPICTVASLSLSLPP